MNFDDLLNKMIYPSVEGLPSYTLAWDFREFVFEDNHAPRREAERRLPQWLLDDIEFDPEMSQFFAYSNNRDSLVALVRLFVYNEPTFAWGDLADGTLPDLVEMQAEMDRLALADAELPLPGQEFEGRTVIASGWHTDLIWAIMSLEPEAPFYRVDEVPLVEVDEDGDKLTRFTDRFDNIVPAAQYFDEQFGLWGGG